MRFVARVLLSCLFASPALAGAIAEVELFDRESGSALPIYRHHGRLYVAGEPGHQYEIRVRNAVGERVLAVTSVDGINVVSGETASERQSGYVLSAYESLSIEGWRKSLHDVATFYFTSLGDSYAARTGRPKNVGVIGVALFRERAPCCASLSEAEDSFAAPAAPAQRQERSTAGAARAENKLGTGHGPREHSAAQYVAFDRASESPDEVIAIYYDSLRNLMAQGVVPRPRTSSYRHGPRPFPNGFVPDP